MSIVLVGSTSGSVTLQEPAIAGNSTQTLQPQSGTLALTLGQIGMKNRIINGAMVIDQRNAGASVTPATTALTYTIDRWGFYNSTSTNRFSVQQNAGSVTPPAGFTNYLGFTVTSAFTPSGSNEQVFSQQIEGFNVADLGWGTANAQTITVSFWVRSSLTGTHSGAIRNPNGYSRSYPFSFTINSANTWEYKTITISGDTGGTWRTNNDSGIQLAFNLGSGSSALGTANTWSTTNAFVGTTGSVQVSATNGATFYITGVQLEVGSTATSFDFRPYGTELALCQRYYEKSYDIGTVPATATNTGIHCSTMLQGNTTTSAIGSYIFFKVVKRSSSSLTLNAWDNSGNAGRGTRDNFGVSEQTNITATFQNSGDSGSQVYLNSGNAASGIRLHWAVSSEL